MSRMDLERIKARCTEDGDCLLWTGKVHRRNGHPDATEYIDGKDRHVGIRRRAYEEYHGVTLDRKDRITTCGNPACLAKAHLERITMSESVRRTHERMDAGAKLRRSQSLAKVFQKARGKVSPEQVAAIRQSEDGPYVMARKLGITGAVASRIKRGISYREYTASPFAGLGA